MKTSLRLGIVRAIGLAVFVGLAAGADCGDAVAPATGVVTGRVVLSGTQTDDIGTPQFERIVMDATGVPIQLRRSDGRTLSATTTAGAFRFDAVPAGTWRVRTVVDPARPIESPPFEVGTGAVEVDEPLRVTSSATLNTYPNPFGLASGVGLEVTSSPGGRVEFEVLTLDLEPVWRGFLDGVPPASYFHAHWGGPDLTGPPGLYWAHLRDTSGDYYDLLFKDE